jgi:ABC-type phosphate transport system permease subunit
VKLFIVLILAIILVVPTVAKMFAKEEAPARRRSLLYRLGRRFGLVKVLAGLVLVIVILPTVAWIALGR